MRRIGRDPRERVVANRRRDLVGGQDSHGRGQLKSGGERLLDSSQNIATTLGRHREDDVAAVEHCAYIAESETFKQGPKVCHRHAPGHSCIVDATKQCDVSHWRRAHPPIPLVTRASVLPAGCRITVELTRRRDFTKASPDELSCETRSRRSRPTICYARVVGISLCLNAILPISRVRSKTVLYTHV